MNSLPSLSPMFIDAFIGYPFETKKRKYEKSKESEVQFEGETKRRKYYDNSSMEGKSILDALFPECIQQILSHLDFPTLVKSFSVCKVFHNLGKDPRFFNAKLHDFIRDDVCRVIRSDKISSRSKLDFSHDMIINMLMGRGFRKSTNKAGLIDLASSIAEQLPQESTNCTYAVYKIAISKIIENPHLSFRDVLDVLKVDEIDFQKEGEPKKLKYRIDALIEIAKLQVYTEDCRETIGEALRLLNYYQKDKSNQKVAIQLLRLERNFAGYEECRKVLNDDEAHNLLKDYAWQHPVRSIKLAKKTFKGKQLGLVLLDIAEVLSEQNKSKAALRTLQSAFKYLDIDQLGNQKDAILRKKLVIEARKDLEDTLGKVHAIEDHEEKIKTLIAIAKTLRNKQKAAYVLQMALQESRLHVSIAPDDMINANRHLHILCEMARLQDIQGLQTFFQECLTQNTPFYSSDEFVAMLAYLKDEVSEDFKEDLLKVLDFDAEGEDEHYYLIMAHLNWQPAFKKACDIKDADAATFALTDILSVISHKIKKGQISLYQAMQIALKIEHNEERCYAILQNLVRFCS